MFVTGSAVVVLAACGGAGGLSGAAATANVAKFCNDYKAALTAYEQTIGDVTDPSFPQFFDLLTKAEAEAPGPVKKDMSGMLVAVQHVKDQGSSDGNLDLSAPSMRVSAWANSNCAGAGSTTSPTT